MTLGGGGKRVAAPACAAQAPEGDCPATGDHACRGRQRASTSRTGVTAILNGDLDHVSSDLLVRILAGLGHRVRVSV